MTFFSVASLLTPKAYADDGATRNGDGIVYQSNSYTKVTAAELPSDIKDKAPDTTGYRYVDNAGKAYFIFMTGDATKATSGYYESYDYTTPPDKYTNPSTPTKITIAADENQGATDSSKQESGCDNSTIGGIGWLVCPTVNFIAKGMDKIYDIISGFLEVKTVTNDTNTSIYQLWATVRDIANVAFVIVFMVIVYSQITNIGLSNYSVKNMLPRLIVAAILVNASFWVCAAAVDASNFLGYSIHNMFVSLMDKFSVGSNYTGDIPSWQQVATVALSTGAVIGGGLFVAANTISGSIFLLIPILLGVVMSALVALIVLAARQALITILIIVAPLAFVAYTMPNTEKYFNKWRETLMTMLLLFPIFSVIFSGAQVAGMAIVQSANGNLITIILGMAVQVAPIVITPLLIKFSGNLIGKVAGIVNNPNKGLLDRTRNWSKGMAQERKNKVLAGQNRYFNRNPINHATKALDTRRRRIDGKRKAYESMADNRFAATRQGQAIEAMNRSSANEKQRVENVFASSARGRQLELQSRNLGVEKQEIENTLLRSSGGHQLTQRQQMAEIDKSRVHNEFEDSHAGHEVDRAKRVVEAEKKRIENTHQANWDNAVRTDPGLYELNLNVKASEAKAAVAKAKLDKVDAEVAAQGHKSEHILNLRGVDMHTQGGMLNIAHDLKKDTLEAAVSVTAKGMADRVIAENTREALKANTITFDGKTVVEYAGGIKGEAGRNAVLAKTKSEVSSALMDDIKNIGSTMDWSLSTDNNQLYDKLLNSTDLAEKVAYAKAMSKNGGPGIGKLRQVLGELGNDGGSLVAKDDLQAFKEILSTEGKIMSAGKDIEFYLTNSAHFDPAGNVMQNADGSPRYKTFNELAHDMGTWKNLSPAAFAAQNASTQHFALEQLHANDHDAYMRIINGIRTNPGALGQVKQGVIERFSIYSDAVVSAMQQQGENPVIGEMK